MGLAENLIEDKMPIGSIAWIIIILGTYTSIVSFFLIIMPNISKLFTSTGLELMAIIHMFICIFIWIIQIVLLHSWNTAIKADITNTALLLSVCESKGTISQKGDLSTSISEVSGLKLSTWAFAVYIITYLLIHTTMLALPFMVLLVRPPTSSASTLLPAFLPLLIFDFVTYIFGAIYLNSIFSTSAKLSMAKSAIYTYFTGDSFPITGIKKRSTTLIIFLPILTLDVYWFCLLWKITNEIKRFVLTSQNIRKLAENYLRQ